MHRFKAFFVTLLFLFVTLQANEVKPSICLVMLVKNDSKVIKRCLESVKPIINHWLIIDLESDDDTSSIIQDVLKDIPGTLLRQSWKSYEINCNEALNQARGKASYLLVLNAENELIYDQNFKLETLTKDCYYFLTHKPGMAPAHVFLLTNRLNWEWSGGNYLINGGSAHYRKMNGITISTIHPIPEIRLDDEALTNPTYVLTLAQEYQGRGEFKLALKYYERRIALQGDQEEVYFALLQTALIKDQQHSSSEEISTSYERAFAFSSIHAEPLYYLGLFYREKQDHTNAYRVLKTGLKISPPKNKRFVENWIYDYGMLFQFSICAHYAGQYEEALQACDTLLANPNLPRPFRDSTFSNRHLTFTEMNDVRYRNPYKVK